MRGTARKRKRGHKWVRQLSTHTLPGTLNIAPDAGPATIRMIAYGPETFVDRPVLDVEEISAHRGRYPVIWISVDGLGDAAVVEALGALFGVHKLVLADVVNTNQRPKVEEYADSLLIVAKMIDRQGDRMGGEQLSMVLGRDYVLMFQERPGDCFDAIRGRAKERRGRLRDSGPDYLAYAILDAVVDEYFPVLEEMGDRLEDLEDDALLAPSPATARHVHLIKRDLLVLRRAMWPLREALNSLQRGTSPLFTPANLIYLRDCYDHSVQALDLIEIYRELANGLMEVYMSAINFRTNEVVRLLTIISTIFMPLTFIVGIYGMNFEHFPELAWPWGYPLVLVMMATIAGGMTLFFRRKGWLGRPSAARITADLPPERSTDSGRE